MSDLDDALAVLDGVVPIGDEHPAAQATAEAVAELVASRSAPVALAPAAMTDEDVARLFHETYEALAPIFDYRTRESTAVAWVKLPEPNRSLMIAVAGVVAKRIRGGSP